MRPRAIVILCVVALIAGGMLYLVTIPDAASGYMPEIPRLD